MHERTMKIALVIVAAWAVVATRMVVMRESAPVPVSSAPGTVVRHDGLSIEVTCPAETRVTTSVDGVSCGTEERRWLAEVHAEPTAVATVEEWLAADNSSRDAQLQRAVVEKREVSGIAGVVTEVRDGYEIPDVASSERTFYGIREGWLYRLSYRMDTEANEAFLRSFRLDDLH